jgi:hypothetical protein
MRILKNFMPALLAIAIGAIHAMSQFLSWASMDAIDQRIGSGKNAVWAVLSFPLFTVAPRDLTTGFFWTIFVSNSLLWAGCALILLMIIAGKR